MTLRPYMNWFFTMPSTSIARSCATCSTRRVIGRSRCREGERVSHLRSAFVGGVWYSKIGYLRWGWRLGFGQWHGRAASGGRRLQRVAVEE
jgi:hypothetical protein